MGKLVDMTGWIMSEHNVPESRLKVLKYIGVNEHRKALWLCECSCEEHNRLTVVGSHLRNGNTLSCGCIHKEKLIEQNKYTKKKYNKYDLSGDYGIVYTNKNEVGYFDLSDYELIKNLCWSITPRGYLIAYNPKTNKNIFMHRLIMNAPEDLVVDHINHNVVDNRKQNLRLCSVQENNMNSGLSKKNTSGVIGVCTELTTGKWKAQISYYEEVIYLGLFDNKDDAIKTRLKAELEYYGDFAPQKHMFKEYGIEVS